MHSVRQQDVEERSRDNTDTESDKEIVMWPDKAEAQVARVSNTEHPRKVDCREEGLGVPEQRSNAEPKAGRTRGVWGRNGD